MVFIYFVTLKELERQTKVNVNIQVAELQDTFKKGGIDKTVYVFNHMIEQDVEGTSIYLLTDHDGNIVSGNLDRWPRDIDKDGKWINFYIEPENGEREQMMVLARAGTFPGGYSYLVGFSLKRFEDLRKILTDVFSLSLVLIFLLAAFGGIILTQSIARRLELVNQVCKRVINGDVKERVPVSGSGDEFDVLANNFNTMLNWINGLIEGIREVSHNIAHDLRSPLNRLRNRLEMIANTKEVIDVPKDMKGAIGEIDSLINTFNAILRISQAEAGAGIEHFTDFDLSETVQAVVDLYYPLAEAKNIRLTANIPAPIHIFGDKHLLAQAFANLLDNAVKYSSRNSSITVYGKVADGMAEFSVEDAGPGIPEEYHEKVKQRFFRLEVSRTTPGSGLGLSLVDAVVKLHKGELWFHDNKPGLKVVVRFSLGEKINPSM